MNMDEKNVWISGSAAERLLSIPDHTIVRVAEAAGIRRREIPGLKPRYHVDDVNALARQAVRGRPLAKAK
jgi:hypothetical protein